VRDTTSDPARARYARTIASLDLEALGWARAVRFAPPDLLEAWPGATPARVLRVDRGGLLLVASGGSTPSHVRDHCGEPDTAVVGDWVLVEPPQLGAGGYPFARARLPRSGVIARQRATSSTAPQALAANVDLVLVVEALTGRRGANVGRIARMTALAAADGIDVQVVLTHGDAADDGALEALDLDGALVTSVVDGRGLDELRALTGSGVTATLLGASGAGKSSLANALLGEEWQATTERRASGFGRHTTSSGQLLPLPSGGLLVDTPGVRLLGMHADVDVDSIAPAAIESLAADCRFRDCRHADEPGCAVTAAIHRGDLPAEAVRTWRKLEREARREQARSDDRLRRELGAAQIAVTREVERARRRGEIRERRR
jgi:ribosome biogenesis GTPase